MAFKHCTTKSKGNPNIGEISKKYSTGPKTWEGKLRQALCSGLMKTGHKSKLLLERECNRCPLKPVILQSGRETRPCPYYDENKKNCPISAPIFVDWVKAYWNIMEKDSMLASKVMAFEQMKMSLEAQHVERAQKLMPGYYSSEMLDKANKRMNEIARIELERQKHTEGEKHQVITQKVIPWNDVINSVIVEEKELDSEQTGG